MKTKWFNFLFWTGISLNTFIILGCIAKFVVWDINYFLASNETRSIWEADFDLSDYPNPRDTIFTLVLFTIFGIIEWYLISLQKEKKTD